MLNFCGYEQTLPCHSYGPAVRPTYLIHYIISGKGTFQIGKQSYELGAGDGFLIEPDVLTYYEADKENPWKYMWVGFSGALGKQILHDYNLTQDTPIFHHDNQEIMRKIINDMLLAPPKGMEGNLRRAALLYSFLAEVISTCTQRSLSRAESDNIYINKAVEFIKSHYNKGIGVYEIAEYVNISRNYLYTLFQQHYNTSVKQFLTAFRMSRALELLRLTQLPIKTIAYSCGYKNEVMFSKVFKEFTGMSPSQKRKEGNIEIEGHTHNMYFCIKEKK